MHTLLFDTEMMDREIKDRMESAHAIAENDRLLAELGKPVRAGLVRLSVVVIALGMMAMLAWVIL